MNLYALGAALLIGVLALWRIDAADSARLLAERDASRTAELLTDSRARVEEQGAVITDQREQAAKAVAADRLFRSLVQTIAKDGAATRQTLQDLKDHDQAVAEYLRGAVPAVYGVQFERPATTDPLAYKPGAAVRASAVPAASPPGNPGQ